MDIFTDFILATGAADFGGPDGLTNLLTLRGYGLQYLLRGGPGHEMQQGGSSIRGDVFLKESNTFRNYKPDEKQTWSDPQVLDNWSIDWRFSLDELSWNDQQVMLNASSRLKDSYRFQEFINMRKKLTMRTVTSMGNGMERQLWELPNFSDMETSAGKVPNSLLLFSNELDTNKGLFHSYRSAVSGGNNEVMGLNKLTNTNNAGVALWDNSRATYAAIGAHATDHLFEAFDKIKLRMGIKPLPGPQGKEMSDRPSKPHVFFTSELGYTNFQSSLRQNQDWFRPVGTGVDPAYDGIQFSGIPLIYIEELDTAPVYPLDAAEGTETTYGTFDAAFNTGPRYHGFDFDWCHKVMHDERYFTRLDKKSPSNQATSHVIPYDTWHNNFCRDLRRQGCIYPSTDI